MQPSPPTDRTPPTIRAAALLMALTYLSCLMPLPPAAAEAAPLPPPIVSGTGTPAAEARSSALISAAEGGCVRLGRASIVVPPGALAEDTEISITRLGKVADTGGGIENATERGGGYRFLPAGQQFQKEVAITLPYDPALNMRGSAVEDIATYFYNERARQWEKLERRELNRPQALVTSASTHFTDMINATLSLPDTAGPLALDINSIKGLGAADPLDGMVRMDAPQGGATGCASFSLPLQVPAGRHGMQPQPAVVYTSGGGNGIMGKGFSLDVGSTISTDTRTGLPKYDGHDVYLKDGMELSLGSEGGGEQEYTALSERAFEKIVRHDTGGADWWEATAKDGTRRLYGMGLDGRADTASRGTYTAGGASRTFIWNLTAETDTYGNSISYTYMNDGGTPYLTGIRYTGTNGSGGAHTIRLTYGKRADVQLDARGRYLAVQALRLEGIEALTGDTVLRRYVPGYTEGASGSSLLSSLTVEDGAGDSYTYRFSYKGLGKDASGSPVWFSAPETWGGARPLNEGRSSSTGCSVLLAGGCGIGGNDGSDVHGSGSMTGQMSAGHSWTESTLADMDGDGRPDAVEQDGGTLRVWRNTGTGFEAEAVDIPVQAQHIDLEESRSSGHGWSMSGGIGLPVPHVTPSLGATYAESTQHGTSTYRCAVCDVDGDGLADILESGADTYLRNMGGMRFTRAALGITAKMTDAVRTLSDVERRAYNDTFYVQTPFRAWRAPYSGTIYIEENAQRTGAGTRTGSLYARTYIGDAEKDEAALLLDLSTAGLKESSGTAAVGEGGYAWFVPDNGGEPEGTDMGWGIRIRYRDVRPFDVQRGLPVPVGCTMEAAAASGSFVPGRLTPAQMEAVVQAAAPSVKAAAEGDSQKEAEAWGRLATAYRWDGAAQLFLLAPGMDADGAEGLHGEFFSTAGARAAAAGSLANLAVLGIAPSWEGDSLRYRRGGGPAFRRGADGSALLGTLGGREITVRGGKVYEDGAESATYTATESGGAVTLSGAGFSVRYTAGGSTVTYGTEGAYPATDGGCILLPVPAAGGIGLEETPTGTWESGTGFSTEDLCTPRALGEGAAAECRPDSPLYGGVSGWHYGIWVGDMGGNPFCGAAITSPADEGDAQGLAGWLSPKQTADGEKYYDYDTLRSFTGRQQPHWYRPARRGGSVAGTESRQPVQELTPGGAAAARTVESFPSQTGDAVHADRAGGSSFSSIEGLNGGQEKAGSLAVPSVRRTATSGTDRTVGGGVGISASGGNGSVVPGGGAGLGGSRGTNRSEGTIIQNVMDVTGDGVPDILTGKGGSLSVVVGSRPRDSWDVTFDAARPLTFPVPSVAHSTTEAQVEGASISPSGSVRVELSKDIRSAHNVPVPSVSAGMEGGLTECRGRTVQDSGFTDINGDGIADWCGGGSFRLGTDYALGAAGTWFGGAGSMNESESISSGANFSLLPGSPGVTQPMSNWSLTNGVNGGIGANRSTSASYTTKMLCDINGDGLPDIVRFSGAGYTVRFNLGSSFGAERRIAVPAWGAQPGGAAQPSLAHAGGLDVLSGVLGAAARLASPGGVEGRYAESPDWTLCETASLTGNIGVNVSVQIPLGDSGFILYLTSNAGGSVDASAGATTAEVRMVDMDGDGLPDQVMRTAGGMWWKRNLAGDADFISEVHYPWGGSCRIDYSLVLGTPDSPRSQHCMAECTLDDGCASCGQPLAHGGHSITVRYGYAGARYERLHRDSYGWGSVCASYADGSRTVTEYANKEFYSRHIPVRTRTYGGQGGGLLAESTAALRPAPYAQPLREESLLHGTGGGVSGMRTEYRYGGWGNVSRMAQVPLRNGAADAAMALTADISWDDSKPGYLHSLPTSIEVRGGDGALLRRRTGSYDSRGALTALSQYHKDGDAAEYTFSYDAYGNMVSASDGLGATALYAYDGALHQYPVGTTRGGGGTSYTSTAEWDTVAGTKTSETDINGNTMRYAYDGWQRMTEARSPYDTGATPAIRCSYGVDGSGRWYSVTGSKVSFDPADTSAVQTVVQADGLGRTYRTAKTGVAYDRASGTKKAGWNAAGAVGYDDMGRAAMQGQPYFIEGGMPALAAAGITMLRPTQVEYDALGRVIKTTLPDGSVQSVLYDVTAGGEPYTRTADPLGNISVQRTDPAGNIIYVERQDKAGKELTHASYTYNAVGEMLRAVDAKGNAITAEYDLLGRKLSLTSADAGRREYKYDAYRLVEETTPRLRAAGKWIGYEYDGLNRLIRVDYPETADTVYTYGAAGAAGNAAGKVTEVEDASGSTTYRYGKLGETVGETRTLPVANGTPGETMTATMGYTPNYLGQMESITYPDGEAVSYTYDAGGRVDGVSGSHYGHEYLFVADIGYDGQGQRAYIQYGNGVRTDYEYDADRRWLSSIETQRDGRHYQNIRYSFDRVGNVLGYTNGCMDGLRYTTSQSYTYDGLYQLTAAHGETTNDPFPGGIPDYKSGYDQTYSFDAIGNMTQKSSSSTVYPQKVIGANLDYSFGYAYAEGYAHRLDHAGGRYYRYDLDGNITMEHHGPIPDGLLDGGTPTTGGGTGTGGGDGGFWDDWDENSEYSGTWTGNGGGTAPAPEGDGTGGDGGFWDDWDEDSEYSGTWTGNGGGTTPAPERDGTGGGDGFWDDWDEDSEYSGTWTGNGGSGEGTPSDKSILAVYEWDECGRLVRSVSSGVTAYYVYGADGMRAAKHTAGEETLYFNRMWTWHGGGASPDQSSKHIYLGSERIATQMNSWKGQQTYSEELNKTYYYHPDHLGSAQLITDNKGHEYQRTEYTPYGELWVDKIEDPLYVYMPYKFNAKELDGETGLYYYGARYLDPMYSVWISPDPALGDYLPTAGADNSNLPGMGGVFNTTNCHLYHYANNNPIRYVDPEGDIVVNPTEFYVLLRTEHNDFVILPPHSLYTGENVAGYEGAKKIIDDGKIDGVVFSDGTIRKISDDLRINKYLGIEKGVNGNVDVTIIQKKARMKAHFSNFKSFLMNFCGNAGKLLGEDRFDFSGYTKVGEEHAGQWIKRGLSQDELKDLHRKKHGAQNQSVFYENQDIQDVANKPLTEEKRKWQIQRED